MGSRLVEVMLNYFRGKVIFKWDEDTFFGTISQMGGRPANKHISEYGPVIIHDFFSKDSNKLCILSKYVKYTCM